MKKPFDQSMYDADDPAKQQILDWLTSQGFNGEINPERTHVLIVGKPYLQSAIIVTKDTIYTTEEQFIEVPLAYCSIESLESKQDDNGTQRRIF